MHTENDRLLSSAYWNQYCGKNTLMISDHMGVCLYFSYQTIIAFSTPQEGLVCCENHWSRTTARHLTSIQPDKSQRKPYQTFVDLYKSLILKRSWLC